jgi:hypothetical protein
MRRMFVITLMGMAIVGGTGVSADAGETKAKMEKSQRRSEEGLSGSQRRS